MPWRGPQYRGELPTLGYYVLDWMAEHLIVPNGPTRGQPFEPTDDQAQFVLNYYVVDPTFDGNAIRGRSLHNARRIRRAVLSRPKGWGKSPLMAALCLAEALADVVPDGWDADGEPVGRSWNSVGFWPLVQIAAVSEDQTRNTWKPLLAMASDDRLLSAYDIEVLQTVVNVPGGAIDYVTSEAKSREGFTPVFTAMDQTESWLSSNGGVDLADTIRRNLGKVGGSSIETPNAFVPGQDSVAESSFDAWQMQQEGRTRGDPSVLVDHREAPANTNPANERSLLAGLAYAYGDAADVNGGWVNLHRVKQEYWDLSAKGQDSRRFFLNQQTHDEDSWLSAPEWGGCADRTKIVAKRETITLGFDGSRKRARGVTDATALIGCRVSDGHIFELGIWEQPKGPDGKDWEAPTVEILATIHQAFKDYDVIGMYADPKDWQGHLTALESQYGAKLKVKASKDHPMHWWMTGGRAVLTVRMTEEFHVAVVKQLLTHDGSAALTRHVLNAHNRSSRFGNQIAKKTPDSPNKIDGAVAAVLARKAQQDAIAAGVTSKSEFYMPKRIR